MWVMRARSLLILALGLAAGRIAVYFLTYPYGRDREHAVPIWLEVVQRICTSIGGLGTFAALIFVIRQFTLLQAQSELVQKNIAASLDGQVYSRLDSFNRFLVEHDGEYAQLSRPYEEGAAPAPPVEAASPLRPGLHLLRADLQVPRAL